MTKPHEDNTRSNGRAEHAPRLARVASVVALVLAMSMIAVACGSDSLTTDDASEAIDDASAAADDALADLSDAVDVDEQSAEVAEALRSAGASSLATLVETIDFDQLTDSAEFTFFAPNDEAFLDMTADETADLLADPDEVIRTLRNHVAAERIDGAQLATMSSLETESGNTLDVVTTDDGTITVGGATVTQADLAGSEGLIHVVDTILIP